MKKKVIILIVGIIVLALLIPGIISWLFSEQYNSHGVSHFLVVTIDKNQEKELIGTLDGYNVYVEGLKIDDLNFRNIEAENVPIKEAIKKKVVSIKEWKKYAWKIIKEGDTEILRFDNYEIVLAYNDCIIRPISK